MIKKLLLSLTLAGLVWTAAAQHTQVFTHSDKLFHDGKELFNQRKWAASYRNFEDFLKNAEATNAGMIQEAEYLLASSAYEMRQDNASRLLNHYFDKHPYSPYQDRVYMMLGMLEYDARNYQTALNYFRIVDDSHLVKTEKEKYLFTRGYANIATDNIGAALDIFNTLKQMNAAQLPAARYYAGYCEYRLGNYTDALPDLLAVEKHPEFENLAPYYVAQIYYSQKNFAEMEKRAEMLLKKHPNNLNNAEIYRMRGEKAYADANYPVAVENLKKYESIFPQVLRNDMYYLGVSLLKTGDPADAVKYLSQAATGSDEMSESAYLQLGNAYVALDLKENARLAFEAATQTNFNPQVREEALFNYALTSYETSSAFGESVNAFEQFIREFPESKNIDKAYDYLSTVYLTSKNYEAAYTSILKIKTLTPKLRDAKQYLEYQIGTEFFTQGNYPKAIELFTKAIQSAPNGKYLADSYFWRGESYYRSHEYARSANDFNSFFKLPTAKNNANYSAAFYSQGYAWFAQKNYSESLNWFTRYLNEESNKSSSTYTDALNRIGDAYFSLRNFTKADEFYQRTIKSNYNGDYALFQSAYISGLNKNYGLKVTKLEELLTQFPNSEYGDDALYEIGRSYLMLDNNPKAIDSYRRLIERYPNSPLAAKSELETGLILLNGGEDAKATEMFKKVIANYPASEEAGTALESLETIYISSNRVDEYLSYAKSLGKQIEAGTLSRADSIQYIAAEKLLMDGKTEEAIAGFKNYLNKYCPGGNYCTLAQYHLAELYYSSGDKAKALTEYDKIINTRGNPYIENAALRCAEISFDNKEYEAAMAYFKRLEIVAQSNDNKNIARLGVLRTGYFLNNTEETIKIAGEIVADPKSDAAVREEALLNRAKAYMQQNRLSEALNDLQAMNIDTRSAIGAEAKFTLSDVYFKLNRLNDAEKEVLDFAQKGSPHQYWLARSFIVLADVNINKGDDFQAKQYLLSLQKNYTTDDDVQLMINQRLEQIDGKSRERVIK